MQASRDIARLIEIMAALRAPGTGCPWDLEQDFASIAPYTLEEAYEVADAIARGDLADLREELGDLLLQVVFWALPYQIRIIAKESLGRFPFLGWHLRRTGHMLVDRRRPDRAAIFGRASRLMKEGLSLIVFPEGTRSRDGRVAPFKGGSFYLALEAGLPVVPLFVGSRHVMLKGRLATYA